MINIYILSTVLNLSCQEDIIIVLIYYRIFSA